MTLNVIPEENKNYNHFQTIDSVISNHMSNDYDVNNNKNGNIHDDIKDMLESSDNSSHQLNSRTSLGSTENQNLSPQPKRNDIDCFKKDNGNNGYKRPKSSKEFNVIVESFNKKETKDPGKHTTISKKGKDLDKSMESKEMKVRFKKSMSFEEFDESKFKRDGTKNQLNIDDKMMLNIDLDKTPKKQFSMI